MKAIEFSSVIFVLYLFICLSVIIINDIKKNYYLFWKHLTNAVIIISFINIILFFLGIGSTYFQTKYSESEIRILKYLNLIILKKPFFIFMNFSYYSMLIGFFLVLTIENSFKIYKNHFYRLFSIIILSISLLLLDSRSVIFSIIIIVFFKYFLININIFLKTTLVIALILGPFFLVGLLFYLDLDANATTKFLSRREVLWGIFFNYYDPNIFHLIFGYGYVGQYSSGLSLYYEDLFLDKGNSGQISFHNTYIQLFVDIGVIGFSFFILSIRKLLNIFSETKILTPLYLGLLFILITAITELTIQLNNIICLMMFIAIYQTSILFSKDN
jgi:hypothetical protein